MECRCSIHVTGIVVWFCDPLSSHLISYQPLWQTFNILFAISNFMLSFSCNFSRQRRSVPSVRRVCKSFCRRFDNPTLEILEFPTRQPKKTSQNAGSLWQVQKVFCSCTQDMSKTQKKLVTHTKSSTWSCFIDCLCDSFEYELRGTTARIRSSEKQSSGWGCSKKS